jgi:hypothetical protein
MACLNQGTDIVYETFLQPLVMQYQPNIEARLQYLRANAGDILVFYLKNFTERGYDLFLRALDYVRSQASRGSRTRVTLCFSVVNSFVGVWMFHVATGFCWRRVSSRSEGTGRRGRASLTTMLSAVTGGRRPGIVDPAVVVTKQARRERMKIYRICTETERITHVDIGRFKCYILCIGD